MSLKHTLTVLIILLIAVAVVGLVLCRPMSAERYARGVFNLAAVDGAYVTAWEYDPEGTEPEELLLNTEDRTLTRLTDLFDGKGFGMTPAGLFDHELPEPQAGDICWRVTLQCTISDSSLTAEYRGGELMLTGSSSTLVAAQDKDEWAQDVFDLIAPLFPEPEPVEDGDVQQ